MTRAYVAVVESVEPDYLENTQSIVAKAPGGVTIRLEMPSAIDPNSPGDLIRIAIEDPS